MDAKKILNEDWLDLLFEGKNKAYGAYDLRKTYTKRLLIALAIVVFGVGIPFCAFIISKSSVNVEHVMVKEVNLKKVKTPPVKKEAPKPKPKKKEEKPKPEKKKETPKPKENAPKPKGKISEEKPIKLATVKKTDIQIVKEPKAENKVQKLKDLDDKQIASFNQAGLKTNLNTGVALKINGEGGKGFGVGGGGTGTDAGGTGGTGKSEEGIVDNVQVEARYDGDWKRFLTRSINQDVPADNGAPEGSVLRVVLSFVVDKEGNLSDIKVVSAPKPDYGTSAEALRAIKRSGRWVPAQQNGKTVISRRTQPIVFQVQSDF